MTAVAPGGALYEGRPRPRALLPALGPLGPVVRPVRPVLAPVLRAALPAHLRSRPFLPPKPRTPPHLPRPGALREHRPQARPPLPAALSAVALPTAALPAAGLPAAPPVPAVPAPAAVALRVVALPAGEAVDTPVALPAAARSRRLLLGVGVVAAVVAVAAPVVLLSPVGSVREAHVQGAGPRWDDAVRAAVAPELGRSALLVDTRAVAARVEAVPGVRAASVSVRWPGTLVVEVDERVAAAAVPVAGGVQLLDAAGADLGVVASAPQGVQRVVAGDASGALGGRVDGTGVAAALAVRAQLPAGLAAEVVEMGATSADGVWFRLRGGATVVWGDAGRAADKADVLDALRAVAPQAVRYDVAAPDAPAVGPG